MSLKAAQQQGPPRRRHAASICSVTRLIDSLPEAEATALREMIAATDAIGRPAWTATSLEQIIEAETGVRLRQHVIARHRRRHCLCESDE